MEESKSTYSTPPESSHPIMDAVDQMAEITCMVAVGVIIFLEVVPGTIIHTVAIAPISALFAVRSAVKYGDLSAVPNYFRLAYPAEIRYTKWKNFLNRQGHGVAGRTR